MKLSLIAIILGPVLVLSLIGVAFNSSSNIEIVVGYHAPDDSTLTAEFIQTLQDKSFIVKAYTSKETCVKDLELGLLHTCIMFPRDFIIEKDKTNEIEFIVDKSRVNIAYNVIDSVSENIGIKSDELSRGLTETLTNTLSSASADIDNTLGIVITTKRNLESANADAQTISDDLAGMDLAYDDGTLDIEEDINKLSGYTNSLAQDIDDIYDSGISLIDSLQMNSSATELDTLENLLNDLNESSVKYNNDSFDLAKELISTIQSEVETIESQLSSAQELNDNSRDKISSLKSNLNDITADIDEAKNILERIVSNINTIEITSSEQIVNPISTKIETVASETNQIIILFPYVLILIIMFVGMMLSSTLVVVEKKSRASFRIFTTPTRDEFFILTTFITAFIIVAVQTLIILIAANIFVVDLLTANIVLNILIIALAAAIFIMIGMAIGYLLPSQQGTNMASISIGAVFLFISNMVLPLETISPYLREIAGYNPYVIASEVLRRSILFNISVYDIPRELAILTLYSVMVVGLIIIFQQISKSKFFKRNNHMKTKTKRVSYSHEYIYINDTQINDEKEFVQKVQSMTDKEYKRFRKKFHKDLKVFLIEKLNKKSISKRASRLSRTQILAEFSEANREIISDLEQSNKNKNEE